MKIFNEYCSNRLGRQTLLIALLFFVYSLPGLAANKLPADVVSAIKNSGFSQKGVGLYVQAVNDKEPLLVFQENKALNPASVIKLVTTAAALSMLGPGYRWTTEISYSGKIKENTLHGNLYFRGNGDPYLTPERFWLLLNKINIYGIHQISGNVIFDNSYFDPLPVDYSAFDGQPYRTYNVGPNAILLGFQATEFHFSIENRSNKKSVKITPFPSSPNLKIVNQVKLAKGPCGAWKKRLSLNTRQDKDMLYVTFGGKFSSACDRKTLYRRVTGADDHYQHFFLPLWQQLGAEVSGTVKLGQVSEKVTLAFQESSISLAEVVRFINKFSNNVMTRQVLLSLGANALGPPGTTQKGIKSIHNWLKENGLDDSVIQLDNGAGLSRDTRISAAALGRLLHFVFRQAYMPEFVASLPTSGYDGTMAHRFYKGPLQGRAHIKTGLLDFVQTMAGYVTAASGERYVVVMLHNDSRAHTRAGEELQNKIIRWIYDYDRRKTVQATKQVVR